MTRVNWLVALLFLAIGMLPTVGAAQGAKSFNVCDGKITCKPVAEAHGLEFTPAETFTD